MAVSDTIRLSVRVSLKFTVRDKYDKPVLVQQAFVRVASVAGDETIFVAEPDNTKAYKVELVSHSLSLCANGYTVIQLCDIVYLIIFVRFIILRD